ncbi:hypothetical protein B0H65DRAFT_578516 [Neurospora tetraspora]|uniref:Uncharacterized protein n=1 Tax=Neurospora tetraspora TaxID=94610 RepID=A0AAE0MPJ5_9PEZI|nr:hypothetical protein B0H65DRAFT_578516 [Neurospora tetraspora]
MAFAAYQPDEENAPPPSAAMNKVNGRALESGVTISPEADKELEGDDTTDSDPEDPVVDDDSDAFDLDDTTDYDSEDPVDDENEIVTQRDPESRFILKAYGCYCAYAGGRKLQVAKALPDTTSLFDTVTNLGLQWAPGFLDMLDAPHAPTSDALASLPDFSRDQGLIWSIYMLLLEKKDAPTMVYIGSGTHRGTGTLHRLQQYDDGEALSRHTGEAIDNGYRITRKRILVKAPRPTKASLQLPSRALFLILETTITYALCAYKDRSQTNAILTNTSWVPLYEGLCSREAWTEGLRMATCFDPTMSKDQLDAAQRQLEKDQRESKTQRSKMKRDNWTPEQRAADNAAVRAKNAWIKANDPERYAQERAKGKLRPSADKKRRKELERARNERKGPERVAEERTNKNAKNRARRVIKKQELEADPEKEAEEKAKAAAQHKAWYVNRKKELEQDPDKLAEFRAKKAAQERVYIANNPDKMAEKRARKKQKLEADPEKQAEEKAKQAAYDKASYVKRKQEREEDPEKQVEYKAKRAEKRTRKKQKLEADPEKQAEEKAKQAAYSKASYVKRKQKREEDPEEEDAEDKAKKAAYQKAYRTKQKQEREADPDKLAEYRAKQAADSKAYRAKLKQEFEADPEKEAEYKAKKAAIDKAYKDKLKQKKDA